MEANVQRSVMVVVRGSDPKESKIKGFDFHLKKDGTSQLSSSGYLFDYANQHYVITSASIILPFYNFQTNKLYNFSHIEIYGNNFKIAKEHVQPIGCIQNDLVTKYLNEFLQSSSSLDSSNYSANDLKKTTSLFLLQITTPTNESIPFAPIDTVQSIQLGDDIYCIGSPYGLLSPHIFQNSVTKGIICNRFTANQQVLFYITDARILPGNEGSAIFCSKTHQMIGFVLPIFSCHLYFVFPIHLVLLELKQQQSTTMYSDILNYSLLLNIENSWASGIYISNGIIITNAHFVRPFYCSELQIFVRSNRDLLQGDAGKFHLAKCIHLVQEGNLDLAVLQFINQIPLHLKDKTLPVDYQLTQGQTVYAIGFPIWSSHSLPIAATITKGTLSNIVHVNQNIPALLQTSALIHNGNSGGLLVNDKGYCIGMITSNTKVQGKNQIVPQLNFAISAHMLQPVFSPSLQQLEQLTLFSKLLSTIWKLEPLSKM